MAQLDAAGGSRACAVGRGLVLGIGAAAIAGAVLGIAVYMLLQAPVLAPAEDGSAGSARVQTLAQMSSESRVESPAATVSGILPFPKPSPPARGVNVESENARTRPTSPASYALSTAQIEALQIRQPKISAAPVQDPVNIVLLGVDKLNHFNGNTDVIVVVSLRPEHQNGLGRFREIFVSTHATAGAVESTTSLRLKAPQRC